MAKYKLSFKNLFTVVIAFFGSFVSTTVGAQANDVETADTPAPKAAGKDAKKEATGSLSAGAIAAAVVVTVDVAVGVAVANDERGRCNVGRILRTIVIFVAVENMILLLLLLMAMTTAMEMTIVMAALTHSIG